MSERFELRTREVEAMEAEELQNMLNQSPVGGGLDIGGGGAGDEAAGVGGSAGHDTAGRPDEHPDGLRKGKKSAMRAPPSNDLARPISIFRRKQIPCDS